MAKSFRGARITRRNSASSGGSSPMSSPKRDATVRIEDNNFPPSLTLPESSGSSSSSAAWTQQWKGSRLGDSYVFRRLRFSVNYIRFVGGRWAHLLDKIVLSICIGCAGIISGNPQSALLLAIAGMCVASSTAFLSSERYSWRMSPNEGRWFNVLFGLAVLTGVGCHSTILEYLHEQDRGSPMLSFLGGVIMPPSASDLSRGLNNVNNPILSSYDNSYLTGDDMSIVIAVRNEDEYLAKTIRYTLETANHTMLKEIVIVDDASDYKVSDLLMRQLRKDELSKIRILRFDKPNGLIRARYMGADNTTASNLFFLDGHCRPKPGWMEPLLENLKQNYKRIICPGIYDITRHSWEDIGTVGLKMMFAWNFEFNWYDDLSEDVPISPGGIFAITRKWWIESGKYDTGMLEWGGENLEQSMRVWMCGGEIHVDKRSKIGHIFSRPAKPNPGNKLVRQVQSNQKRAAMVWLDEYYEFFETFHPIVKKLDQGPGIAQRVGLRADQNCHSFSWYFNKFRSAFERKGLLVNEFHHIQHKATSLCLSANHEDLSLQLCDSEDQLQQWSAVAGGRMLLHRGSLNCFDKKSGKMPGLYNCDWTGVFKGTNKNQFVVMDSVRSNHIFTFVTDFTTFTGNDLFAFNTSSAYDPSSTCLEGSNSTSNKRYRVSMSPCLARSAEYLNSVYEDKDITPQSWRWLW